MNELIARLAPVDRKLVWDLFDGARVIVTVVFARTPSKEVFPWEAEIRRRVAGAPSVGCAQGQGHSKGAALAEALALYPSSLAKNYPPVDWARVKEALGRAGALQG